MHHILLYECKSSDYNGDPEYLPGDCSAKQKCQVISFGWAIGGQQVT